MALTLVVLAYRAGWVPQGSNTLHAVGPSPVPVPEAKDVETRLFLLGDAGVPAPKDPVLRELNHEVTSDPGRSVVVFLGDNIYPRGMPPKESPDRKDAERRIDAQMAASRVEGATTIFIPGNHDWDKMGVGGWDAIRREGEYVRDKGGPGTTFLPEGGCPGPVVRDFNTRLRLVVLDTQWWLQAGPKPKDPDPTCAEASEGKVLDSLDAALLGAGDRRSVVVAHHPLATGGTHGGSFSWKDHLFPLRAGKSWLWIPLPGIGSAYPVARRFGATAQDISGTQNRKMREALEGVFEKHPPLLFASGHEHNLQVLKGKAPKLLLISGAGAFGHVTQTAYTQDTVFASASSGYMRLDIEKSGRVRLAVITVDAEGHAKESLAMEVAAP
jgi:hypothetical protein